jgi:hypothetical protein
MNNIQMPERDEIMETFFRLADIGVTSVSVSAKQYDWWLSEMKDVKLYPRKDEHLERPKAQINGVEINII